MPVVGFLGRFGKNVRNGNVRGGLSAEGLYSIVSTWAKAIGISTEP